MLHAVPVFLVERFAAVLCSYATSPDIALDTFKNAQNAIETIRSDRLTADTTSPLYTESENHGARAARCRSPGTACRTCCQTCPLGPPPAADGGAPDSTSRCDGEIHSCLVCCTLFANSHTIYKVFRQEFRPVCLFHKYSEITCAHQAVSRLLFFKFFRAGQVRCNLTLLPSVS